MPLATLVRVLQCIAIAFTANCLSTQALAAELGRKISSSIATAKLLVIQAARLASRAPVKKEVQTEKQGWHVECEDNGAIARAHFTAPPLSSLS